MTGKNEIRLNGKAMAAAVQHYFNDTFAFNKAPKVTSVYQAGNRFIVSVVERPKTSPK